MRRGESRGDPEAGTSTVGLVLVTPVLWLCVALVIQYGLWAHAGHVVRAAAQEGARTGRVEAGTEDDATARASQLLAGAGEVVSEPDVSAERTDEDIRVEVRAKAVAIVPGLNLHVRAVAFAPVERFREPDE